MSDILVIGGGFAGVWSAAGAARLLKSVESDLTVALVAPDDDLVMRPRLYEAGPDRMRVPLDGVLGPIGVRRVKATVTDIDTDRRKATAIEPDGRSTELSYQRLVLAAGSRLIRPGLPGAEHLFDIDTIDAAVVLDEHIHALPNGPEAPGRFTAVVVGSGFTGLEIATELVHRLRDIAAPIGCADDVRVMLVERADVVGPELGEGPRPAIMRALDELGVELCLGETLESLDAEKVVLSRTGELHARTVIWTAGMLASPLTAQIPAQRDRLGRLEVDAHLQVVGVPGVFAAGDTANALAEPGRHVMQSCQHASPLGRFAGHNVAADLLGLPAAPFDPDPYVTCLALGEAGAVFTTGWDREVRSTGEVAKKQKRMINEKWIYPPVNDADAILRRAAYTNSSRATATVEST